MKTLLFTLHGIGSQFEKSAATRGENLVLALEKRNPELKGEITLQSIYYIDILQNRQERIWEEMVKATGQFGAVGRFRLARRLWFSIRQFMIYNFSDATIIEHGAASPGSVYRQIMDRLERDILRGWEKIDPADFGSIKVIVLADSMGGHVISNYIWDMQSRVFDFENGNEKEFGELSAEEIRQVSLQPLSLLITTACNIPFFVSGMKHIQGIIHDRLGYGFRWLNYFDMDDLLGWPLQPLGKFFNLGPHSRGTNYADLVQDRSINVSKNWIGRLFVSWNPVTHRDYWETPKFISDLAEEMSK